MNVVVRRDDDDEYPMRKALATRPVARAAATFLKLSNFVCVFACAVLCVLPLRVSRAR